VQRSHSSLQIWDTSKSRIPCRTESRLACRDYSLPLQTLPTGQHLHADAQRHKDADHDAKLDQCLTGRTLHGNTT
jgi:hypothetical protein